MPVLDLELMKLCFASISWAQFAVFEAFSDEGGRADPDPSSPRRQVTRGRLWNGGDSAPACSFGFRSKEYAGITTVYRGTSTGVGPGYLEDTAGDLVRRPVRGFRAGRESGTVRTLTGSNADPAAVDICGVGDTGRGRVRRPQSTSQPWSWGSCRTGTAGTVAMARCSFKLALIRVTG